MNRITSAKTETMNFLLEATRSKALQWRQAESGHFEAAAGEHRMLVVFKYPLLANNDGSDADIAEVHVPGITLTFFNGTEGFDLVTEMLAESIPRRKEAIIGYLDRAKATQTLLRELTQKSDS